VVQREWIVPAAVMALWIGSLYSIEWLTGDGDIQAILFVVFSFVAGLLAKRWWVLIVPFTVMVALFTYDGTNPWNEGRDELAGLGQLFVGLLIAIAAAVALVAGIGVRRAVDALRRRSR
jgi:hypothetical protein